MGWLAQKGRVPGQERGIVKLVATWRTAIPSRNRWDAMSRFERGRRKKEYRRDWRLLTLSLIGRKRIGPPYRVRFIRISPGVLDDDNLSGAFKPIRDGIADALGVDDSKINCTYAQELGESGARVEIEVEEMGGG